MNLDLFWFHSIKIELIATERQQQEKPVNGCRCDWVDAWNEMCGSVCVLRFYLIFVMIALNCANSFLWCPQAQRIVLMIRFDWGNHERTRKKIAIFFCFVNECKVIFRAANGSDESWRHRNGNERKKRKDEIKMHSK